FRAPLISPLFPYTTLFRSCCISPTGCSNPVGPSTPNWRLLGKGQDGIYRYRAVQPLPSRRMGSYVARTVGQGLHSSRASFISHEKARRMAGSFVAKSLTAAAAAG